MQPAHRCNSQSRIWYRPATYCASGALEPQSKQLGASSMWRISLKIVITLLTITVVAATGQEIPAGTVLPIVLNHTLDAGRARPGEMVTGKIMQDIVLPGATIPEGTRVLGHVVSSNSATATSQSHLVLEFDQIVLRGRHIPVTTHLRALASMSEIFEAKMPTNSFDDYGTSTSDWNTVQVGGAGVYRGNGQVVSGDQVVGRATDYGAVTAKLIAVPPSGCRGDDREQSLWVFSPWACGLYGFEELALVHSGKTPPLGQIELQSSRNVHVAGGSGWLLRVGPTDSASEQ